MKKKTPTQLPILRVLWNNPKTDVAFLQRRTGFSKSQIHHALHELKKRKLINPPTYKVVNKTGYKVPPIREMQIKLLKEKPFHINRLKRLLGMDESKEPTKELPIEKGGVEKRYIFIPDKLE